MVLTKRVNSIYVCLTCGSEIMLVRGDRKRLEPVCCNRPMQMPVAGSL
jgi:DNA-directed RNA polymerase subunit RPC12/RpoP